MRHFVTFSSFVVLLLHVLAGRGIFGSSWSIVVTGLLTGVWLGSVGPDRCLVKEDGSTWGSCTS